MPRYVCIYWVSLQYFQLKLFVVIVYTYRGDIVKSCILKSIFFSIPAFSNINVNKNTNTNNNTTNIVMYIIRLLEMYISYYYHYLCIVHYIVFPKI